MTAILKILFVIPYFYPAEFFGGPVRTAFETAKKLAENGHEIRVFTSDAKDLEHRLIVNNTIFDGVTVSYLRNLSMLPVKWSKLCITPSLDKELKKNLDKFDLIHVHEYTTYQNIVVHKFARKYHVPYILQAHGSLPIIGRQGRKRIYDALFGANLLKDASQVIALNRMEFKQYIKAGVTKEKISIIPNGLDLSHYEYLPDKGTFKQKFSIGENKRIILFLGRLNRIKGLDTLVAAFKQVVERFSDVVLVIAGPDDGYLSELNSLIKSLRLNNSILLVGPLYGNDKLSAYIDAEVFVLPSTYETFPVTILEAYACSKPVIASSFGSLSDLVLDEITGLLFEVGSTDKLASAIIKIINRPEAASEMGLNGKKLVYENFNTERVACLLESIYSMIL